MENIFITQIRLGRRTKEQVIDHLKANIKREAELLQQSITNDSSFIILDVANHIHQLQKYNTFLWEVANYELVTKSKTQTV